MLRRIFTKQLLRQQKPRGITRSVFRISQIRHISDNKSEENDLWFKNGLDFKCTGCGKCCSWEGDVWLSEDDIKSIYSHLDISRTKFMQKYVKYDSKQNKFGLKAKKDEYKNIAASEADHCIFLHNNKCLVYKAKPTQCTTYPFWPDVVWNKESWEEEKDYCEGINRTDGEIIPLHNIMDKLKKHVENDKKIEQQSSVVDLDDKIKSNSFFKKLMKVKMTPQSSHKEYHLELLFLMICVSLVFSFVHVSIVKDLNSQVKTLPNAQTGCQKEMSNISADLLTPYDLLDSNTNSSTAITSHEAHLHNLNFESWTMWIAHNFAAVYSSIAIVVIYIGCTCTSPSKSHQV